VTNPPDNPNPVPSDSPTTPAAGVPRAAWYRRLPGHLGIWVAAAALVAACVIGSCGFIAGAVASHGFGEHSVSRDDRWGNERRRGDDPRDGGRNNPDNGPRRKRGNTPPAPPAPAPTGPVTPAPAQPSTPSPTASPTA
jgi:hypothetical protein